MVVISVDDLIARNRQAFAKFKNPHIEGLEPRVDPVLKRLLEEALASVDLSKGVILDGYQRRKTMATTSTFCARSLIFRRWS